eukprot:184657-Chlamydomonas_euryale.AAC.1
MGRSPQAPVCGELAKARLRVGTMGRVWGCSLRIRTLGRREGRTRLRRSSLRRAHVHACVEAHASTPDALPRHSHTPTPLTRTLGTKDGRNQLESEAEAAVQSALGGRDGGPTAVQLSLAVKEAKSAAMRAVVLDAGRRMDGRGLRDVRVITSRATPLPRTHGSALFTRGETQ